MEEIKALINEVRKLKVDNFPHRHYSTVAKIPFKVQSFAEIMNCRMLDFCESVDLLISNNHIIPSVSIIRGIFENLSITNRVLLSIRKSLEFNKLMDDSDELIMKIIYGTRYGETEAINILTQLDKLDKEYEGIRLFYDSLCEFVHPNWDGVEGSYSILHEEKGVTDVLKVITKDHEVFKFFKACFIACMKIYIDLINKIRYLLPDYAKLCEIAIQKKG
jgi:hypothetical protein